MFYDAHLVCIYKYFACRTFPIHIFSPFICHEKKEYILSIPLMRNKEDIVGHFFRQFEKPEVKHVMCIVYTCIICLIDNFFSSVKYTGSLTGHTAFYPPTEGGGGGIVSYVSRMQLDFTVFMYSVGTFRSLRASPARETIMSCMKPWRIRENTNAQLGIYSACSCRVF